MKRLLMCISVMMGLFLLLSCSKSDDSGIKIGLIAELTGDIPAVGASCKNAAELAVKEINSTGGLEINGKKHLLKLIIEDSSNKPEQAVAAAQKLITQNKVVAIIGPNSSSNAIPASEIAETSKVTLITPWSTNPKATLDSKTGAPKKFVFRAAFTDSFQGQVVAGFVMNTLKAKKAAVLYDIASDYNKGIAEIFKKTFEEKGGKVVAFESYTTNDKDFSAQLTKIKSASPDVLYLPNYYNEIPLQVQQAQRLGLNIPIAGSDSWGSEELLTLCGKSCEGYYFSTHYSAESASPAVKKFIEAYSAAYGKTPDDVAALTYDSFTMLKQAILAAGSLQPQAIRDGLSKMSEFDGVTGKMHFAEGSGDPVKSAVILQIKNGKFIWFADAQP